MSVVAVIHRTKAAFFALLVAMAFPSTSAFACGVDPYFGEICLFAFKYCPQGYLPADGRSLKVKEYTALYALLGSSYGGDTVEFNLPDMRKEAFEGKDMSKPSGGTYCISVQGNWPARP